MKLAIVGSTAFSSDEDAKYWADKEICEIIEAREPELIISGGALGIDTLAYVIAMRYSIESKIYWPATSKWAPNGFKDRNILIANACDELVSIRHYASKTYGSGWTADRAEEQGKSVTRLYYRQPEIVI